MSHYGSSVEQFNLFLLMSSILCIYWAAWPLSTARPFYNFILAFGATIANSYNSKYVNAANGTSKNPTELC